MSDNSKKQTVDWHSVFFAAACFVFRNEPYEILREYELNKRPIRIDVLIKNQENYVSSNGIASFFHKINVIEYKSPEDSLSYLDFYKSLGYANLYMGHSKSGEVLPTDVTVSIFRDTFPRELLKELQKFGYIIINASPGVYYVTGKLTYPVQIVVTSRLSEKNYLAFKMLSQRLVRQDFVDFMQIAQETKDSYDRENIDAILHVSVNVDRELCVKLKEEDSIMYPALRELFKEELMEAENKGRKEMEDKYNKLKAENDARMAEKDARIAEEAERIAELEKALAAALAR